LRSLSPWWLRPQTAPGIALLVAAASIILGLALPVDRVAALMSEHGLVESSTVALYAVAALMVALFPWRTLQRRHQVMLVILLAAFGARELDLHKSLTQVSMLRFSFYFSDAPLAQRVGSALVLIPVVVSLLGLARQALPLLAAVRRLEPAAVTVATFILTMLVSKVADRSINILAEDFTVVFAAVTGAAVLALEEMMELSLPVLACLAWAQARYSARVSSPATPASPATSSRSSGRLQ
jgi:hypothetical protein